MRDFVVTRLQWCWWKGERYAANNIGSNKDRRASAESGTRASSKNHRTGGCNSTGCRNVSNLRERDVFTWTAHSESDVSWPDGIGKDAPRRGHSRVSTERPESRNQNRLRRISA